VSDAVIPTPKNYVPLEDHRMVAGILSRAITMVPKSIMASLHPRLVIRRLLAVSTRPVIRRPHTRPPTMPLLLLFLDHTLCKEKKKDSNCGSYFLIVLVKITAVNASCKEVPLMFLAKATLFNI
jgi:hypothetical protein